VAALGPVGKDVAVDHPDAPVGKSLKYTRPERERRFLLGRATEGPCVRRAVIIDRYIVGTRIRLRQTVETTTAGTTTVRKLTQKIPAPTGGPGLITTLYVSEAEYEVLRRLPAATLTKTRYSVPPFGLDVFGGELAGLVLAEIEFSDDEAHARFDPPVESVAEVTQDVRLTGGRFTQMPRAKLLEILSEYGLTPVDATELAGRPLEPED
jgi:CYTH domain-containing protein